MILLWKEKEGRKKSDAAVHIRMTTVHRIITLLGRVGLEGTPRTSSSNPLAASWLPITKPSTRPGCHGPIQRDLGHLQGWGIQHLSRQPVPVPHHPFSKELFPYIQSNESIITSLICTSMATLRFQLSVSCPALNPLLAQSEMCCISSAATLCLANGLIQHILSHTSKCHNAE